MKKYIVLFLLCGFFGNAQYNLFARQNFANKTVSTSTNTEIGGVASTISTPALLATKLGIDVSRITNFSIVGSDIKCRIIGTYGTGNYFHPDGRNNTTTYYLDNDGLITNVGYVRNYPVLKQFYHPNAMSMNGGYYGRECAILNIAYFPKLTSCGSLEFYGFMEGKQAGLKCLIYIPLCTTMVTPTTGQVFGGGGANSNTTIYCHPSLATNNAGAPDNDIAYAISQGATVRYVTNFTAPNPVTTLAAGTIYNTAIQLNFTPPSSTNAIDYYELYINGIYSKKVVTGDYITGLTPNTFYNIKLKAVDIFYNKSVVSNSLSVSTINSSSIIGLYENRVYTDGGVTVDPDYLTTEYSKITSQSLETYLLAWHNYKSGIKKDGSEKVEKMYSFVDSNFDVVQTTAANKPTYTASGITFDLTDNLSKTLSPVVTNKTFSVVWRLKSTPGNYYPTVYLGGWDSFVMHSASGGLVYSGITLENRFVLGSGSFLTNTDATYTFTYNSTTKIGKIYRDATLLGSKTMVDPIDWKNFTFDAQNGTFYDIKVFSKDLSLTEITNIL